MLPCKILIKNLIRISEVIANFSDKMFTCLLLKFLQRFLSEHVNCEFFMILRLSSQYVAQLCVARRVASHHLELSSI